jgi:hypothetical protein
LLTLRNMRTNRTRAVLLVVTGLAALTLQTACGGGPEKPKVASLAGEKAPAGQPSATATQASERPRHRVDESEADRERIIAPWTKCMKDHGADLDTQPHTIAGAEKWSRDHQDAGTACGDLLPLLPWGLDRSNPQYRDNIHQWVKCMNDKGLNIVETPDNDEQPWTYGGDSTVVGEARDKIERDCEKATIGKFDK